MSEVEAVLLTGGASRRMGSDKASLVVDGAPLSEQIAAVLAAGSSPVTIFGKSPIPGYGFVADEGVFEGPLAALARLAPIQPFVFVASCDLVGFDLATIDLLASRIGTHQAGIPSINGRLQPLCALYRADAFRSLRALYDAGERRMMRWVDGLDVVACEGVGPRNVNTPEELETYLRERG